MPSEAENAPDYDRTGSAKSTNDAGNDRPGGLIHNPSIARQLCFVPPGELKPNGRNARTHSKKQIRQIADSIREFGFNNPILVDGAGEVIAGHGRLAAAELLRLETVPVLRLGHLSAAAKRAYVLADNKIALNAGWDTELLARELGELADLLPEINIDLEVTGFDTGELDFLLETDEGLEDSQDADVIPDVPKIAVSRPGDIWQLGKHRILCGDARDGGAVRELLGEEYAGLVLTDPPYNVKVNGHVGGRGKTQHSEFAFASGEMSDEEFAAFLRSSLEAMGQASRAGTLLYVFMDWRHIELLLAAGRGLGLLLRNICVWNKTPPGQGSFYRSAHELIAVFVKPGSQPANNVQLGRYGRNRSNVWTYPSVNTFQTGNGSDFALHPTVKPVAMIVEAIKDASQRGEIVLDPFLGSGTTLLAAEQVGRRCFGVEFEALYVDVAIRRWQASSGRDAVLLARSSDDTAADAQMGLTFDELATPTSEAGQ